MLLLRLDGNLNLNGNIMKKALYSTKNLIQLFHQNKVLTFNDIQTTLGTKIKMTVFRKLKTLSYRTSYSHTGKYYTLDDIAKYNKYGLWSYGQIHFSKYGTLSNTIEALVCASEEGYFANELEQLLQVRVYDPLLKLFTTSRLLRKQIVNEYLYLSPTTHELQFNNRQVKLEKAIDRPIDPKAETFTTPEVEKVLHYFLLTLNERQRRLYVGFESLKLGYGGDTQMAKITGINIKTIAKGRTELLSQGITPDRIRKVGGGRHPLEKKRKS